MALPYRVLGNGSRTDHPVPDLPFVQDVVLPLHDPEGIEALGRHRNPGTWGRTDPIREDGQLVGWTAYTTDPHRHDLAWLVRHHVQHGTSVLLVSDEDGSSAHDFFHSEVLAVRAGGYWWNGRTWYRPRQVWDDSRGDYARRAVPAAHTVTAADFGLGDPGRAAVIAVQDFDVDQPLAGAWRDHLAAWAQQRGVDARPLQECTVTLTAPELMADRLLSLSEVAARAGLAASTLRAYASRGEAQLPDPQFTTGGRSQWAEPVVAEWIEARERSSAGLWEAVAVADQDGTSLPVGLATIRDRLTAAFAARLGGPRLRQRWALRWRSKDAITAVASELAYTVVGDLQAIVPLHDLAATVRHALLDELAVSAGLSAELGESTPDSPGIGRRVGEMLGWLARVEPRLAQGVIGETIYEAVERLGIPAAVSTRSLELCLVQDSGLRDTALEAFLQRALPPRVA